MSGISSRATNGKVTKIVASTMPGTAKMMRMSCASSQAPNHPWAPNSSTKINPEITGETANGRSISVIRQVLALELELGDGPRRRQAEARFSVTAAAAASSVRRMAESASGSRMAAR
jgi:hypothetical protein